MELDKRQWYVRWFFWSLMIWDEFKDRGDSSWHYENGTNLCHFLRVMIIWCPLVLVLNIAVYASGLAVLTVLPIYFWGAGYAYVVVASAIVVGVILGLKALLRRLKELERERAYQRWLEPTPKKEAGAPASTGPGFFEILWKYLVGLKQRVCPIITFNRHTQGVAP